MSEEKYKLGQEPAYPVEVNIGCQNENEHQNGPYTIQCHGMSKRFYAACAAMQGLLSNPSIRDDYSSSDIVRDSFMFADKLLEKEKANLV